MITLINGAFLMACVVAPSLFVVDLIIMVWIKFTHSTTEAAYAATAILSPLLIVILIFGVIYYRQTIKPCHEDSHTTIPLRPSEDRKCSLFSDSYQSQRLSTGSGATSSSSPLLSSSEASFNSESVKLVRNSYTSNSYGATGTLTTDSMIYFGFSEF
jgi:hypothetical protein